MNARKNQFKARCEKWGGVITSFKVIPEHMGMQRVIIVKIQNKKGVSTLVLNGQITTFDGLLAEGTRVRVFSYYGHVMEIQDVATDVTLWESDWDLDGDVSGFSVRHRCENSGDCPHWVHFYEMSQEARFLFFSLHEVGGIDSYGHYYWHPSALWGGRDSWEVVLTAPYTIVCIDDKSRLERILVTPSLYELRETWRVYFTRPGATAENDFQNWLKALKQFGAIDGWWRFAVYGSGNSLFDELTTLGITCDGGSHANSQ